MGSWIYHGPWFVRMTEVQHLPTRMFYDCEVFMSNIRDTNPMRSIMRKCAILFTSDYLKCKLLKFVSCQDYFVANKPIVVVVQCTCLMCTTSISGSSILVTEGKVHSYNFLCSFSSVRPTDIPEEDVFVCESQYNEAEKSINRMKSLKVELVNLHELHIKQTACMFNVQVTILFFSPVLSAI